MQIAVGTWPYTIGAILAFLVILLSVLGLLSVVPFTPQVVFALLIALGLARLI